jgi:hypothetical protein
MITEEIKIRNATDVRYFKVEYYSGIRLAGLRKTMKKLGTANVPAEIRIKNSIIQAYTITDTPTSSVHR